MMISVDSNPLNGYTCIQQLKEQHEKNGHYCTPIFDSPI